MAWPICLLLIVVLPTLELLKSVPTTLGRPAREQVLLYINSNNFSGCPASSIGSFQPVQLDS